MGKVVINKEKCKGCLLCISVCPRGALKTGAKLNKKGAKTVIFDSAKDCAGCAMCAIMCPECCIEVYR